MIDLVGNPRHRRVSAVLESSKKASHLFEVLTSLNDVRSAQLARVGGVKQNEIDQVGWRNAVDQRKPFSKACPSEHHPLAIFVAQTIALGRKSWRRQRV
jgi:hypothetical protein